MPERGPVSYYARGLARNVVAGLRLALFLRLRASDFRVSAVDYAVLAAFNFACWVFASAARAGFAGEPDLRAPEAYLATVGLVLFAALLVALAYRMPERLLAFAVALSASDALFELAAFAVPALGEAAGAGQALGIAFIAWNALVALRAVIVCGGTQRPAVYRGAVAVLGMMAVAYVLLPRTDAWIAPQEEEAGARGSVLEERLFHRQGELIEEALAGVASGRAGVPELYFVGFAPDASQDVFLSEMRYVRRLFDERLGAASRSIALASSETALDELPIASVTNLGRALARVGQAMNPDEDVLFLYLSAHGDREHRLSVSQPPLELASLTPTALARLLHESSVKWRVVVVSACYSGGFIEPLRDANTVVITAAAADRTSFGCQTGREFTYFGEAYFRDALSRTRSFVDAFAIARDAIARREQSEGLAPSQPQIWVGEAIAAKLKDLAQ